jgi:hypothetical protein
MSISAMVACRKIKAGSPALKSVLLAMADVAWDDGSNIWISTQTLSDHTELCLRAVIKNIDHLVKMGILQISEVRPGRTTVYRICPKIMAGTWQNPCTTCTPAPDAPLHQMQDTPAPDASPPLHVVHPTPAPDADDPNVTPIKNSIERNARVRVIAERVVSLLKEIPAVHRANGLSVAKQTENVIDFVHEFETRHGEQSNEWWIKTTTSIRDKVPDRLPSKYGQNSTFAVSPAACLRDEISRYPTETVSSSDPLVSAILNLFEALRSKGIRSVPSEMSAAAAWASELQKIETDDLIELVSGRGESVVRDAIFCPTAYEFSRLLGESAPRKVVVAISDEERDVAARNLEKYGTETPSIEQIRAAMKMMGSNP